MIGTALVGVGKSIAATRGQQVVGILLTTIPLAERMLLYQFAMTAWLLLPNRGLLAGLYPQEPRVDKTACAPFFYGKAHRGRGTH